MIMMTIADDILFIYLGRKYCLLVTVLGTTLPVYIMIFTTNMYIYGVAMSVSGTNIMNKYDEYDDHVVDDHDDDHVGLIMMMFIIFMIMLMMMLMMMMMMMTMIVLLMMRILMMMIMMMLMMMMLMSMLMMMMMMVMVMKMTRSPIIHDRFFLSNVCINFCLYFRLCG